MLEPAGESDGAAAATIAAAAVDARWLDEELGRGGADGACRLFDIVPVGGGDEKGEGPPPLRLRLLFLFEVPAGDEAW